MIAMEKANNQDEPGVPVSRMCVLLGVSRSGYYAWSARQAAEPTPAQQRRERLTEAVRGSHAASGGVYGAPRVTADLREAGHVVSRKTVAKLMRENGIVGVSPRPWRPVTTIGDASPHAIADLVGRRFDTGTLNRVWTSDITYLATGQGWLYLCAVRDGCSRRVLGYAFSDTLHTDIVEDALRRAVTFRAGDTLRGDFAWRPRHPVHLDPTRRRRVHARGTALGRTHWRVLGQRPAGELLVDPEDRVRQPTPVPHPRPRDPRDQRMDRDRVQPHPTPLPARHAGPGNLRRPAHHHGASRLTRCPSDGVNLRLLERSGSGPAGGRNLTHNLSVQAVHASLACLIRPEPKPADCRARNGLGGAHLLCRHAVD